MGKISSKNVELEYRKFLINKFLKGKIIKWDIRDKNSEFVPQNFSL